MSQYSIKELEQARELSAELGLAGSSQFCRQPVERIRKITNGIGAEWQPEAMRRILDRRFKTLKVAAMVHDVNYHFGTGADTDFHEANHNLYVNGCILAKHFYGWYDPRRYMVMLDAAKLSNICEAFGRRAYDEAIEARRKEETQA